MDKLIAILTPPETPHKPGSVEEWREAAEQLGTDLPADYKEFLRIYGTGGVGDFLWILTPFDPDVNINLSIRQRELCEAYLVSKTNFPEYYPYEAYPAPGGLLPWAYTDNGDELYWLTEGPPDQWTVVVYESRSPDCHVYPVRMTDFLYGFLSGETPCEAFPDDFPDEDTAYISVE
ncbi:SMI1/KNR4 family protein [Gorillibacterium sp. CAU 1737]|uniref:SMI1/KNR4 family protein n=1 Tax=Gorillibacterium sp. CAU 1737 TaxID=3140362 RepID=UPI003261C41B